MGVLIFIFNRHANIFRFSGFVVLSLFSQRGCTSLHSNQNCVNFCYSVLPPTSEMVPRFNILPILLYVNSNSLSPSGSLSTFLCLFVIQIICLWSYLLDILLIKVFLFSYQFLIVIIYIRYNLQLYNKSVFLIDQVGKT